MAALTTGSWTITYLTGERKSSTNIVGRKRYVDLKLSLTTGEAPAAGVPLPRFQSAGMVRYLDGWTLHNDIAHTVFSTAVGRALKWGINATANTIIPYTFALASVAALPSGGRVMHITATTRSLTGAKVFFVTARGW